MHVRTSDKRLEQREPVVQELLYEPCCVVFAEREMYNMLGQLKKQ